MAEMYRNVLLIAPGTGLAYAESEMRGVSSALRPDALRNGVTVRDVTERMAVHTWDVVWFACHGSRDGVELSAGETLPTAMLIQLVRSANVRLVVLNTCESEQIGAWIHMQTDAAVICTIGSVGDKSAYVTGRLLAESLAQGLGVEEAFARSRPGDVAQAQLYRLFSSAYTPGQDIARWMEFMTLAIQPLRDQIDDMQRAIASMQKQLTEIEQNANQITPAKRWAWIMAFILFVAAMPLYLFEVRTVLGLIPLTALALSIVLWAFSLVLFLYGLGFIGDN
jgi:hypothetical protein